MTTREPAQGRRGRGRRDIEPGYRPTQLPPDIAMRAREVARPTAEDLAEADRDLVIVRKHYVPPDRIGDTATPRRRTRRNAGTGEQQPGAS